MSSTLGSMASARAMPTRCFIPPEISPGRLWAAGVNPTSAKLQDELLEIVARTQSTVVMVTHDVDEAVLLSDKIVMMTNGPSATIGEVLSVDLPRPRNRVALAESTQYQHYRKAVIDFLYTRQVHVEKAA